MNDEELQDPGNWDFEHPVPVERGPQSQRTIVSVPFKVPEFRRVRLGAEQAGEKLATFIRQAALEKADALAPASVVFVSYSQEQEVSVSGLNAMSTNLLPETANPAKHEWFAQASAV